MRGHHYLTATAVAAVAPTGAQPAAAQERAAAAYALPAQPLSASIREVARISGRSVIAPSRLV